MEFAPPPGNQGHPWLKLDPSRTWEGTDDWKNCFVDFWWFKECLKYKEMLLAMAQCWPADATCATVGPVPNPSKNETWTVETCRYCRFRAIAPADTPPSQQWWYGTGDGKHSANRCPRLRRFLANGGDATKFPDSAHSISEMLRMKKDYADQHKPAQK